MLKVKPVKNRLIVKIVDDVSETGQNMILTKDGLIKACVGEVMETSDVIDDDQDIFMKGDRILFMVQSGQACHLPSSQCVLISQEDVYAFITC